MLALNSAGDAIEIVDRRLFLFLQGVDADDLEEILDSVQPRVTPKARNRNHISTPMTEDQKNEYVARLKPGDGAVADETDDEDDDESAEEPREIDGGDEEDSNEGEDEDASDDEVEGPIGSS
jgi:hypothetical protein